MYDDDTGKLFYYRAPQDILPLGEIDIRTSTLTYDVRNKDKPGLFEIRYKYYFLPKKIILLIVLYNILIPFVYMYVLANYPFNFERKNRFSLVIFNFFDQTGSRFFGPIFFTNHYYQT